jgi:hypothetical protein
MEAAQLPAKLVNLEGRAFPQAQLGKRWAGSIQGRFNNDDGRYD